MYRKLLARSLWLAGLSLVFWCGSVWAAASPPSVELLPAVTPTPQPTFQATPAPLAPGSPVYRLLAAINRDRAAHHAPRLALDKRQSACSLRHSRHMARRGVIAHDQFPADICIPHVTAAENLGVAYGQDPLVLHRMMMREGPCPQPSCPNGEYAAHGHYLNLLNAAYRRIGIGIVWQNGLIWLTEDFTA